MKYSEVKEFQCFFVFRQGELKSWLITCICKWLETKNFNYNFAKMFQSYTNVHVDSKNLIYCEPRVA